MNGPVNNTFSNEAVPLNKNIKLETEQDNVAQMISFFFPHHMTETNISHEHESEITLNDKVSPQFNLNMKTDELEINYLHSVKIEEEIEYPDHQENLLQLEGTV